MIANPLLELLVQAGFNDGWAICDGVLVLWEHDENPPAPLTRPDESQTSNPADDAS